MIDYLKPISGKHSIAKVISTVFFPQEVLKPEQLFEKISNSFDNKYVKKGTIISHELILDKSTNETITQKKEKIIGFIFEEFDSNGKVKNILKLENIRNQYSLRFETRSYTDWNDFKNRFILDFNIISRAQQLFIEAFSLTYVDEFEWTDKSQIDTKSIFRKESELISSRFLNSLNSNIIFQNQIVTKDYLSEERIELSFNNIFKRIMINHQLANKLDDIYSLEKLLSDGGLISRFDDAHDKNKELLQDLLLKKVQEKIGLIK